MQTSRLRWFVVTVILGMMLAGCSFETAGELVQLAEKKSILLQNETDYEKRFETYGGNAFSAIDRQVLLEAREAYEQALAEVKIVKKQEHSDELQARLELVKDSLDQADAYESLRMEALSMEKSTEEIVNLLSEGESDLALISRLDDFKRNLERISKISEPLEGLMKEHFDTLYVEPAEITLREAMNSLDGVSAY
ncbi:hypothetical protein [Bacillus sp. EB01]|uniref:hypothetical protein n=1 Tax=Bacillus sp. EB01 TaxID=1347086 RepID=UPI0005C581C9|nr:hypothetical protein [Bacillus sp. EB01]